jgi:hypothetical protein
MSAQRLVRSCGYAGAPVRNLDLTSLHEALTRLLRHDAHQGHLIVQLVVEGLEPATVAAARGVSRAALVERLRDAIASLAGRYEHRASGELNDLPLASLQAALGSKRAPGRHSSQRHGTEDPNHQDQGHADPYHP